MTNDPHDALFKATFSQPEHVAGELRTVLPAALSARIDFATLALEPGSFVDEAFAKQHSDLLFSAQIAGRRSFVYVLCEHQSAPHRLMPYRLLKYEIGIWDAFLATHPGAIDLPAILPVVVHHSRGGGWTSAVAFEDLLDVDPELFAELAPFVPRFRFLLDDLDRESDEALHSRAMSAVARLVLFALKHARDGDDLSDKLGLFWDLMKKTQRAPNGVAALGLVFRYIVMTNERVDPEKLRALVAKNVGRTAAEAIVTAGERLIEQGRQQGLLEGVLQGKRESLLSLLRIRFRRVGKVATDRVNGGEPAELERWTTRILTAESLAAVFAPPVAAKRGAAPRRKVEPAARTIR